MENKYPPCKTFFFFFLLYCASIPKPQTVLIIRGEKCLTNTVGISFLETAYWPICELNILSSVYFGQISNVTLTRQFIYIRNTTLIPKTSKVFVRWQYRWSCVMRPPLGPLKSGLSWEVVSWSLFTGYLLQKYNISLTFCMPTSNFLKCCDFHIPRKYDNFLSWCLPAYLA